VWGLGENIEGGGGESSIKRQGKKKWFYWGSYRKIRAPQPSPYEGVERWKTYAAKRDHVTSTRSKIKRAGDEKGGLKGKGGTLKKGEGSRAKSPIHITVAPRKKKKTFGNEETQTHRRKGGKHIVSGRRWETLATRYCVSGEASQRKH